MPTASFIYKQVELCQGLPFEVRIPNAETLAVLHEIEHHPERLRRYSNVEEMFDAWEAGEAECRPLRKRVVS
jgi:antitoxin component of RelBE/YafQ-DinJ toxin-antitoxin module